MKIKRIVAMVMALAMMLVYLPMQTSAEEQHATLTPKKFEQMKTITNFEDGVYTFTTVTELIELSNKAQSNPGKEYLCLYVADWELHIDQNLIIPENMSVAVYYSNNTIYNTHIYIEQGVEVELRGYIETYSFENKGVFRISPSGMLYTKDSMKTYEGMTYNSGTIVSDGGYAYGVMGAGNIHNEGEGLVQLSGYLYNQKDLIQSCQQAEERDNGHWLYFFKTGNPYMPFDTMTVTVPSNYSLSIDQSQKIVNSEMDVYGSVECTAGVVFNGKIRIQPGGMVGIGAKFTMQGAIENYGIMAVVSGVEDLSGSLVMDNPKRYKDVSGSNRGGIIVVAKAGEEYPAKTLADMSVNSFTVDWYQADGNSYWILTDYQDTLWVLSGTLDGNIEWKLEGDVLTISGTGKVTGLHAGQAPWYDMKEEVKKLVIGEGITDYGSAAFSLNRMTEIEIADTVTILHNFEKCHSLEVVTVPASVKETGAFLFRDSGVKTVYFEGDAPKFHAAAFVGPGFGGSDDLTVMYPAGNDTWTEEVRQDYGGNVTWIPYCNHNYETVTVEADCITPGTTSHICSKCGDTQVEPGWTPPLGHDYGLAENGKDPDFWDTTCDVCGAERVVDKYRPTHSMYRMYNPNSGEHFYTGSMEERKNLEAAGWKYEGVGFTFPATTGKPVYRLYDKFGTMEHLYTMDEAEKEKLLAEGWILEGVAFNSGREDEVPQYRLHNPNATIGAYHFTASTEEKDALIAAGWEYQGVGFYTCLQ